MNKKQVSIVYYSRSCCVEKIADTIADGCRSESCETFTMMTEEVSFDVLNNSDAIIFGSPTYFGSVSGEMKSFFDNTSKIWMSRQWQNKIAGGFTHSSNLSGDKQSTLYQMMVFALQHGMIWAGLNLLSHNEGDIVVNRLGSWSGLMTQSSKKNQIDMGDLKTAFYFGVRIAKITKSFQFSND